MPNIGFKIIISLILAVSLCTTDRAIAQETRAYCLFSSQPIQAGDTFNLNVSVSGFINQPAEIDFSPWNSWLDQSNILRKAVWKKKGNTWLQQFTLILFDSLVCTLPPLIIKNGEGTQLKTAPVELKVAPIRVNLDQKLEAPRNIKREDFLWTDFVLVFLVLGLVCIYAVVWYRKAQLIEIKETLVVKNEPEADELAIERLYQLEAQGFWEEGDLKKFYSELSQILKEYLERRYNIPAMESTTAELAILLSNTTFQKGLRNDLNKVLSEADLVKYAQNFDPSRDYRKLLQTAEQIVIQSRKQLLS